MRGILNINKHKGFTSFDVIAKLRKILNVKRIGHAGTLDPLATGVLPVFVGNVTRLIQFIPKTKAYRAYARLGIETNTYDIEGEVIAHKICKYDLENIKDILNTFKGKQLQIPPKYSAISVNGKRLYEYARKNQDVEIPQKEIEVFDIKVVDFDNSTDFPLLTFDISCASGVYVRSIIHDLGEKLNSGAMMENLTRTMSAGLLLENSVNLNDISINNVINYFIDPADIIDLPFEVLDKQNFNKIKTGQHIFTDNNFKDNTYIKLLYDNMLVGIGISKENTIQPKIVIV